MNTTSPHKKLNIFSTSIRIILFCKEHSLKEQLFRNYFLKWEERRKGRKRIFLSSLERRDFVLPQGKKVPSTSFITMATWNVSPRIIARDSLLWISCHFVNAALDNFMDVFEGFHEHTPRLRNPPWKTFLLRYFLSPFSCVLGGLVARGHSDHSNHS